MKSKNSAVLEDIENLETILPVSNLNESRVRKRLTRFLLDKHVFKTWVGDMFIKSLSSSYYQDPDYKDRLLGDCARLRKCLEWVSKARPSDLEPLKKKIQDSDIFSTWAKDPFKQYILSFLEYRKESFYTDANKNNRKDLDTIRRFSEDFDLEDPDDIDELYGALRKKGRGVFSSYMGDAFLEALWRNSTSYKKLVWKKRGAAALGIAALCAAVALASQFVYLKAKDYRAQVEYEILNGYLNASSEMETGDSYEEEGTDADMSGSSSAILDEYKDLYALNRDLVGYLHIESLGIGLPVMQKKSVDGYYLSHGFNGEESREGALFIDSKASFDPPDKNLVIYGHNMKNGEMFGGLLNYQNEAFYEANPEFSFDTIYEKGEYEIVGVMRTRILKENEEGFRYYRFRKYDTEEQFRELVDFLETNSLYETKAKPRYGDEFVMLSTCEYSEEEGRFVVVGRKKDD